MTQPNFETVYAMFYEGDILLIDQEEYEYFGCVYKSDHFYATVKDKLGNHVLKKVYDCSTNIPVAIIDNKGYRKELELQEELKTFFNDWKNSTYVTPREMIIARYNEQCETETIE